jgi:peptide deformylase
MKILRFPHPALFTKCDAVTEFNEDLKSSLDQMWDVMTEASGIGLAANQVGIMDSYFVMKGPIGERVYCVNPYIEWFSLDMANLNEGCLSAPGDFLTLPRTNSIVLTYKTETGFKKSRLFSGIHSVCAQHELEHLNGKAFLESPALDKKIRKELAKKWGLV